MMQGLLYPLTLLAAISAGLIAGVFYAFSTFVMRALGRLPAAQGIAAMQSINVVVINPAFLGVFLGAAALSAALVLLALLNWQAPGMGYLLAGGVLYLAGTLVATMAFNVPLNNALAVVATDSVAGADLWAGYLSRWTFWNHVRTGAALLGSISFILALRVV